MRPISITAQQTCLSREPHGYENGPDGNDPGPDDDSEADDTHVTAAIPAHPATFAHRFRLNGFVPVARILSGSSGSSSVRCSSGDIGWAVEEDRQLPRQRLKTGKA